MTKPKKPPAKKPSSKPRPPTWRRLKQDVLVAVRRAISGADVKQLHALGQELLRAGSTLISAAEGRSSDEAPIILWSSEPVLDLLHAVSDFATYTGTPIENVVYQMLMRIGPHVDAEHRWN